MEIEDKVLAYINQGIACKERGDYEDAIKNYNEAIKLDSNSLRAYGNRGITYGGIASKKKDKGYYTDALGYYDKAIYDFEKVINLDKNNAKAYNSLGIAYAGKSACFEGMKNGNAGIADHYKKVSADKFYNEAIEYYEKAIKLDPNFVLVYINRGNAHLEKGEYGKAITDYNKAIQLDKYFEDVKATTFCDLGTAHYHNGNYSESIDAYDKAINLDSNYATAYHYRGNSYYMKCEYGKAITDYNQAIQLDPNNESIKQCREAALNKIHSYKTGLL
ncbi:hypothetical protein R83H12_02153 [Fibrobacteria bacterium R8-3-H12]